MNPSSRICGFGQIAMFAALASCSAAVGSDKGGSGGSSSSSGTGTAGSGGSGADMGGGPGGAPVTIRFTASPVSLRRRS